MRRSLGFLLLTVLLMPSAAAAHSSWVETNPDHGDTVETLPAEATVTLSEAPTKADVVLATPDGEVRALRSRIVGSVVTVKLPHDGPRGAYELSYRVVSADGHPVSGSAAFTVTTGPAPATSDPAPAPTPSDTTSKTGSAVGGLVPFVLGLAVLSLVAMVLVARSLRR